MLMGNRIFKMQKSDRHHSLPAALNAWSPTRRHDPSASLTPQQPFLRRGRGSGWGPPTVSLAWSQNQRGPRPLPIHILCGVLEKPDSLLWGFLSTFSWAKGFPPVCRGRKWTMVVHTVILDHPSPEPTHHRDPWESESASTSSSVLQRSLC